MTALTLTRKLGASIIIDENVKITFIKLKGRSQVVLRIEAPESVKIDREEKINKED